MTAPKQFGGIRTGLKTTLQSVGSTGAVKGLGESIKSDPASWTEIAAIPGLDAALKENPDLLGAIIEDPAKALETYRGATAQADKAKSSDIGTDTPSLLNQFVMQDPAAAVAGLPALDTGAVDQANNIFNEQVQSIAGTADKLDVTANSYLSGQLPPDVAAQIRTQTSEASMAFGLGTDQAAASLTARDLGLNSVQLQQQGAAMAQQSAALRESAAKLSENQRQFNMTFALNRQQFENNVRELNLKGLELDQARQQFNASQNMQILQYMVDLTKAQQQLGFNYAMNDIDSSGMMSTTQSLLDQMSALLG